MRITESRKPNQKEKSIILFVMKFDQLVTSPIFSPFSIFSILYLDPGSSLCCRRRRRRRCQTLSSRWTDLPTDCLTKLTGSFSPGKNKAT